MKPVILALLFFAAFGCGNDPAPPYPSNYLVTVEITYDSYNDIIAQQNILESCGASVCLIELYPNNIAKIYGDATPQQLNCYRTQGAYLSIQASAPNARICLSQS